MISPRYIRLQAGFSEWLRILNFEPTSQRDMPKMLTEFLEFLEANQCTFIHEIQEHHIKSYIAYLYERANRKFEGGLSVNYIRKQMQVIRKFARYLTESGQESFGATLRIRDKSTNTRSILTTTEITQLYEATTDTAVGLRDKAMLALYYGCGLRKNEGVSMNVNDVLLNRDMVFVRKGKGYQERYVPLTTNSKADLENYIYYARPYLLINKKDEALLLSVKGKRLNGTTAYCRLQQLITIANIPVNAGLHTLRHSIATHLLSSGMKLEQIQRFLGHTSLESTQIYTHLQHEQDF
jgi:site-specific recombinase XerD